jgi:branched-chain amino acid transport system permease protein
MLQSLAGVLFDGLAYGSLLFLISIGLSVTLGLMNFINLAHGVFAMFGGYICARLMASMGVPFLLTLPIAFIAMAAAGALLELLLARHLYKRSHLDQVLFSIGIVFMSVSTAGYFWGSGQQPVNLPPYLSGQVMIGDVGLSIYRLFMIAVVAVLAACLILLVNRTRFGAMIRASVDNMVAAAGLGINVSLVFSVTFALGSGLAGIGGALGISILSLDPNFALKYMIYFLIVVTVGGAGSIAGTLISSLVLGTFDIAGKYYVPEIGGFVIYLLMIVLLLIFPGGLNRRGLAPAPAPHQTALPGGVGLDVTTDSGGALDVRLPGARWRMAELAVWVAAIAVIFVLPGYTALATQVLITGLFALSLDLVMGYAGIISLGHAALFGCGAYAAGLLARHGWGEPLTGLLAGGAVAGLVGYLTSFLIRGGDITRLMVTLGICLMLSEAGNRAIWLTGGIDGLSDVTMWKIAGLFAFDLDGRTGYLYALAATFVIFFFARRLVASPFGLSLRGIRESARRMPAIGSPVAKRLRTVYTISSCFAGIAGALLAQTTQFVGLDVLSFTRSADLMIMLVVGGVGWLYGGFVGAAIFIVAQDLLSSINPIYWQFWLGLILVLLVFLARGGLVGALVDMGSRLRARAT